MILYNHFNPNNSIRDNNHTIESKSSQKISVSLCTPMFINDHS